MPELPEVEALRRAIARRFLGAELVTVEVRWPRLVEPTTVRALDSALAGAPARRAIQLNAREARRLHSAVVAVTRDAVEYWTHALRDLRGIERWFEGFEEIVAAYDRASGPCHRCAEPIRAIHLGGRRSSSCPRCQPRTGRGPRQMG